MSVRTTLIVLAVLLTAGCSHATSRSLPTGDRSVPRSSSSVTPHPLPATNPTEVLARAEADDASGYWLRRGVHLSGEGIGANVVFIDVVPADCTRAHVAAIKARYGQTVEVDPMPYAIPG